MTSGLKALGAAIGCCCTALCQASETVNPDFQEYTGIAHSRHSGGFLFGEHHWLQYRDGHLAERMVLYTCADGTAFARKAVHYQDPTAPDFLFEDISNGMREGVREEGVRRVMFFRPNHSQREKSADIPVIAGLVADAGFDEFIRIHWTRLLDGEPIPFPFLVPSRFEYLRFNVQHVRSDRIEGQPSEVFRLKLAGVLGWVMSGIDVTYAREGRQLQVYEGLSELRDAAGDNLQTHITFNSRDRHPSSEPSMNSARQAVLRVCR
jgi:hypothetical protein